MEIKNVTLFFIGIAILMLGILIIIFDYPQIQYIENEDSSQLLDGEKRSLYQRLVIEFSAGIGICGLGILLLVGSFLKRFENGLRQ
ncbi:hypothetical protein [Nitrosopumilus sp.]|uniref:hypothetical protein n=1 Tax=Nitrosopumilus sp. TaxID=2024843 RepID=UPI00292DCFA7|nr:hypothetical protein [Nitrosopumilus sp.]